MGKTPKLTKAQQAVLDEIVVNGFVKGKIDVLKRLAEMGMVEIVPGPVFIGSTNYANVTAGAFSFDD